jgi:hypothetical protein
VCFLVYQYNSTPRSGQLIERNQKPCADAVCVFFSPDNRPDTAVAIQSLIETADFSDKESRGNDAINEKKANLGLTKSGRPLWAG